MGVRNIQAVVFFLLLSFIYPLPTFGNNFSNLRISQVSVNQNSVETYLMLTDTAGDPGNEIDKKDIKLVIDNKETAIRSVIPFKQADEGVGYVLLLDISKTIKLKDFEQVKTGMSSWIDEMNEKDMAAIMVFGENVHIIQPFTASKSLLKSKLKDIVPKDNQNLLHSGLVKALDLANTVNSGMPKRRAVITFSNIQEDFCATLAKPEVQDRIKVDKVPVYAIGFYELPLTESKNQASKVFGDYAKASGGELYSTEDTTVGEIFAGIRRQISNTLVVKAYYEGRGEGPTHHIAVTASTGGKTLGESVDVSLIANTSMALPSPAEQAQGFFTSFASYLATVFVAITIGLGFLLYQKKHKLKKFVLKEYPEFPRPDVNSAVKTQDIVPTPVQSNTVNSAGDAGLTELGVNEPVSEPAGVIPQAESETGCAGGENILPLCKLKLTVIRKKGGKNYRYNFLGPQDKCVVGRHPDCPITIGKDREVSGKHCELWLEGNKVWLRDLQSTNGTFVNGVKIQARAVESGDVINIGRTELRISFTL